MNAVTSRSFALLLLAVALAMPAAAHHQEGDDRDQHAAVQAPVEPGPIEPLAARLCDALHAVPGGRQAACCGAVIGSGGSGAPRGLAGECTRLLSAALRAGSAALEPAAVERCERASAAAFAGCDWVTPLAPEAPAACRGLVAGLREAGAACASSLECRSGLACRAAGAGAPAGTCAPPAAAGEACGGGFDLLATYLRAEPRAECAGSCHAGRCADAVAAGGMCLSNAQCATGSHCAAGRCVAGAFAALEAPCTGSSCGAGAICRGGTCRALKRSGEACGAPFECLAACNIPAGATTGTCGMRCPGPPSAVAGGAR